MNGCGRECARARRTWGWTLVLRAGSLLVRALCVLALLGAVRRRATGLVSQGGCRVGQGAYMVVGGRVQCRLRRYHGRYRIHRH